MNQEISTSADNEAAGPLAGERLAEARRLRQISLPDIARELHLDEPKVQALEENRFEVLGAPVFARGHLRKYAEIVGVPLDDIMADYHRLSGSQAAPPIVGDPRPPIRDIDILPWVVGVPLLLIALGAAWWWAGRTPAPTPVSTPADVQPAATLQALPLPDEPAVALPAEPSATPEADAAAAAGLPSDENAAGQTGTDAVDEIETAPAETEPQTIVPSAQSAGDVVLELRFSGDCWTEVTDADGERLFFDLGRAGRTVSVSGTAPLRVLLGDSRNASLRVNGAPYALSGAERRGDTARLTINQ